MTRLVNNGAICKTKAREAARLLKWQKSQKRKKAKAKNKE